MWQRFGMKVNPWVFFTSSSLIVAFVILGASAPEALAGIFDGIQTFIVDRLGWFYILAVSGFLVFVLYLMFSKYGDVKLGNDDDEPEFSRITWFAMLFSAGMGIGLLFYSVAEPILHFSAPPRGEPGTVAAAEQAMRLTFFHWGLHAWAVYIVVGLSLAYFSYRHGLPLTVRSSLYPLLGDRVRGRVGDLVDILAVFGTLFGVATSLGLGVMQVNAGLEHLGIAEVNPTNELILIAGITTVATISVVSGLDKGIRRLSELNLGLGLLLLLFVLFAGPTSFIVASIVENVGNYLEFLPARSLTTDAYIGTEWQSSWTMFYWGWWISWSPFVGMFIARVSRGRTIREFVAGVLLAPTAFAFIWLGVFGNSALWIELFGGGGIAAAVQESVPVSLFVTLEQFPLSSITAALGTIVVITYFVTSSDSGSLVIDILTADGDPDPPVGQRIFWALTEGAVAAILLLTGGLVALQTAAITTALPFSVVMVFMAYGLLKGLRAERRRLLHRRREDQAWLRERRPPRPHVPPAAAEGRDGGGDGGGDERRVPT